MSRGLTVGDWIKLLRDKGLENASNRYYSLYPATVTEDADPQQQGRACVHLKVLGFPEAHIRPGYPVSPYAGENYGFYFPPHKDAMVFVSFDHGDVNSTRIEGSWWLNKGDDKKPETSYVPAEFCKMDGSAPTARGIKSRGGSVFKFEDQTDNYHVELSSGTNPTEEVEQKDENGNVVGTIVTIKIGEKSEKHHRLRFDDANENVVLASFGVENPNAQTIDEENDSDLVKDQKELDNRLRQRLVMQDKSDARFIRMATIGDDDTKFHQVLLSDTEKKIRVSSTQEHFFEIDDENEKSEWSVKNAFRWLLDQKNKLMVGESPAGRKITFNDDSKFITLESPDGQQLTFNESQTLLEDTQHDINVKGSKNINVESKADTVITTTGAFNVEATGASMHNFAATLMTDIKAAWTHTVAATGLIDVTGALTLKAASIVGQSASILLGTGTTLPLVNSLGLAKYNSHIHLVVGAFPGVAIATPNQMIPTTDATIQTLAS